MPHDQRKSKIEAKRHGRNAGTFKEIKRLIPEVFKNNTNLFNKLQEILKSAEDILEKMDGVSSVHGRYYDLSSSYHKLMGNHAEYYREALRFLGCADYKEKPGILNSMSNRIKVDRDKLLYVFQTPMLYRGRSTWDSQQSLAKAFTTSENW